MHNSKIGIVTFPISNAGMMPLQNMLKIILRLTDNVHIITGNSGFDVCQQFNNIHCESVHHFSGSNAVTRIYNYAKTQLKITFHMIKISRSVDFWIFPISSDDLILSVILAKIQRKPVIMALTSSSESVMRNRSDFLSPIVVLFSKINYFLASSIILYSPNLISEWGLDAYRHKIQIAHEHFLDFDTFTITTPFQNRSLLIGYIGRLSNEKGVHHFIHALPAILISQQNLHILICGDGDLKKSVETILLKDGFSNHINYLGWISHEEIPQYLNQLRLLVLPSYTEGLPNIMLEAMACGTPVLATPVGTIPDVIQDGETGFIMKDNSPECITDNVLRVLESSDLESVSQQARRFVMREFTFEKTMEMWTDILRNVE